jgi:two-component system phosphate regulon sensor histidine kinase PhoR
MKKKIIQTILGVLIFSVIILTILFIKIINHQYMEYIKQDLSENNDFVISVIKSDKITDKESFFKENLGIRKMRVTYINNLGNVILDSKADEESMDNHNNRPEVIEARKSGMGYSLRYSSSLKRNMLYVATALEGEHIIRSSMPVDIINSFEKRFVSYYLVVLVIVLSFAIFVSYRLAQIIVKPIKDLKSVTFQVANGQIYKRIVNFPNDEIGDLAKAFNNMSDKLQKSLKETTVKQIRLEAILKSMDSGVIAIDKDYRLIMINPYAKEIFGINKDIIGYKLMDIIRDFELENVFKHSSDEYSEIKLLWPKERELRIRTAEIISEGEAIGTVAVVQDITDIRRLENMRSQFVANVSHELKTPLTSIKGFAETLKDVEDAEQRDKFLDIINDEAERLTRLINDILILSSLEQHREGKTENININEVVKEVYELMKHTANSKGIEMTLRTSEVANIIGDRDRLKQAIINLVDNSIKYSESGAQISIVTSFDENKCVIIVEDTGVGMSKEHLSRIFERFYRIDKARSRTQGGTGLGLAIVKHIVLNFNGSIDVESETGKGTRFTIRIPAM